MIEYDPWAKGSFSPSSKTEEHTDIDCALNLFGASLTRKQCWEIVKNHNESFELKDKLEKIEKECDKDPRAYTSASFIKKILSTNKDAQKLGDKK